MSSAQATYLVAVGLYLAFFLLFIRFFFWKAYADRTYWKRRPPLTLERVASAAAAAGRQLPRISVIVPARNESAVIRRTLEHMFTLRYPSSSWELVVATDEKEALEAARTRPKLASELEDFLRDALGLARDRRSDHQRKMKGSPLTKEAASTLQFLLARLSRQAWVSSQRGRARRGSMGTLAADGGRRELEMGEDDDKIIHEITSALVDNHGLCPAQKVKMTVARYLGMSDARQVGRALPAYLAAAMPAAASYWTLSARLASPSRGAFTPSALLVRMARSAARAHHDLTVEVLTAQTEALSRAIIWRLHKLAAKGGLRQVIEEATAMCSPTTQEIVEQVASNVPAERRPEIKHVVVPYDFDGKLFGQRLGREVPSTKGRALNYALESVDPRSEVCGFFDAESRPHRDVLLYVALGRLTRKDGSFRVLQGPVFQVRNFFTISPFCRIASLYQAVAHEWYLPVLFRRLPFVGGTNLFVEKDLLLEVKGFHPAALTEDLELGCRLFMKTGTWPEYLPYPSSEQTPPTVRAFFRQRLRWGSGHLQVVSEVINGYFEQRERRRSLLKQLIIKGELEWVLYQAATLVPPAVAALWAVNRVDASVLPHQIGWVLHCMSLVYLGFTWYIYRRYSGYFDTWSRPEGAASRLGVLIGLLLLPLAAFMFPLPYSAAIGLHAFGRSPAGWVKTPRTQE